MPNDTKTKIQDWLMGEGWTIKELNHDDAQWLIEARDPDKRPFLVGQQKKPEDQLRIQTTLAFDEKSQEQFSSIAKERKDRFLWEAKSRLLMMGLNFAGLGEPLARVTVTKQLYEDGLNKTLFAHTMDAIRNGLLLVLWAFQREMSEPAAESEELLH